MTLKWSSRATREALDARAYVSSRDPTAARRLFARLLEAAERIVLQPGIGRIGRMLGTRELLVRGLPYIVVYRISPQRIEIVRVLHTARHYP